MTLPHDLELDAALRSVARVPNPKLRSYVTLDVRLAWHPTKNWELAVVGQNLLDPSHGEFATMGNQPEAERGGYAQVTWKY